MKNNRYVNVFISTYPVETVEDIHNPPLIKFSDQKDSIVLENRYQKQIELENESWLRGRDRIDKATQKAIDGGFESETYYGKKLLNASFRVFSDAVQEVLDDTAARPGAPSAGRAALSTIRDIPADKIALITLRQALDSLSRPSGWASMCMDVGKRVEDELIYLPFIEGKQALSKKVLDDVGRVAVTYEDARTRVRDAAIREGYDVVFWDNKQRAEIGNFFLRLMVKVTGWFKIETKRTRNRVKLFLSASEECVTWINSWTADDYVRPAYLPMIHPPRDWSDVRDGGYLSDWIGPLSIIKIRDNDHVKALEGVDMPEVYKAINAVQATPWRVNSFVLGVLSHVVDNDLDLGKLPLVVSDLTLPPRPSNIPTKEEEKAGETLTPEQRDQLRKWRWECSDIHSESMRQVSKKLLLSYTINIAQQFQDYEEIYFPYQLDFRGRMYAVPMFLTPQGHEVSKSLLCFAEGKNMTDEGAAWLAIHGANCFGKDKLSYDDRIAWVEEHNDLICAVAEDPLNCKFWNDADKPWMFLAFCEEWAGWQKDGYDWITQLPVQIDGTCNGIQHFSALLRDSTGGKAVNLIDDAQPQDIYKTVADTVIQKMMAEEDPKLISIAQDWLGFGINRKTTKRQVMVVPYGGTYHSCRSYTMEWFKEVIEDRKAVDPDYQSPFDLTAGFSSSLDYLAHKIWDSITEVIISARDAMDWLQNAARLVAKNGHKVEWTLPTGFKVIQSYNAYDVEKIQLTLSAQRTYIALRQMSDKVDPRKQVQSVSPNFVHSLDAMHLMRTVNSCSDLGIKHFSMVHDSYGTLAVDVGTLSQELREEFAEMYEQNDFLHIIRDQFLGMVSDEDRDNLPDLPNSGSLNVGDVRFSSYFFS